MVYEWKRRKSKKPNEDIMVSYISTDAGEIEVHSMGLGGYYQILVKTATREEWNNHTDADAFMYEHLADAKAAAEVHMRDVLEVAYDASKRTYLVDYRWYKGAVQYSNGNRSDSRSGTGSVCMVTYKPVTPSELDNWKCVIRNAFHGFDVTIEIATFTQLENEDGSGSLVSN